MRPRTAVALSALVHAVAIAAACRGAFLAASARWRESRSAPMRATLLDDAPPPAPLAPPQVTVPEVAVEVEPPHVQLADEVPLPVAEERAVLDAPLPAAAPPPAHEPKQDWLERLRARPPQTKGELAREPAEIPPDAAPPVAAATPQVDAEPSPLPDGNEPPEYPFSARRRGLEGTVVVLLQIDAHGHVESASVEASSGSAALDDAALQRLREWTFAPARRGSVAVRSTHRETVVFRLRR
jgi:protein TonB